MPCASTSLDLQLKACSRFWAVLEPSGQTSPESSVVCRMPSEGLFLLESAASVLIVPL